MWVSSLASTRVRFPGGASSSSLSACRFWLCLGSCTLTRLACETSRSSSGSAAAVEDDDAGCGTGGNEEDAAPGLGVGSTGAPTASSALISTSTSASLLAVASPATSAVVRDLYSSIRIAPSTSSSSKMPIRSLHASVCGSPALPVP